MTMGIGIGLGLPFARGKGVGGIAIQLARETLLESASIGALVGTLSVSGLPDGVTVTGYSITADPDSKFVLDGNLIELADTLDYETATSHSATIEATLSEGDPLTRTFSIAVGNVLEVTLNDPLTLSAVTFDEDDAPGTVIGAIQNKTSGSTVTVFPADGRVAISGTDLVVGLTAASVGSFNITLRETHPDAETVDTVIELTVQAGAYAGPDIVIVGYGQSNWLKHLEVTSSPDAASAGTYYWDPTAGEWTDSVPAGNGIRKLLNAVKAAVGDLTVGVVSAGQNAVAISALMEGDGSGYFDTLASRISASGASSADELYIVWQQGEGDANTASPNATTYKSNLDTLHQSIVDEVGRTKAQMPLLCSGLATVTDASFTQPDSSWATIQSALISANDTYPNIHYSHSNLDATLDIGGVHWTAASYGRSGERFARTLLAIRGDVATSPAWFIDSVERVSDTELDVTVTHSMGSDFTGETGFEVSDNGGANWITATAARESGTVIRLTHDSISMADDVPVRYGYGKTPDMSDPVLDNGALASPLVLSAHQTLIAEGSSALPVPTFVSSQNSSSGGASQAFASGFNIGSTAADVMVIVAGTKSTDANGANLSSLTLTPNGGSPINGTIVLQNTTGGPHVWMAYFLVPAATAGADNCALALTYAANPFGNTRAALYTVPQGDLDSTTPVDSDQAAANSTAVSLNISTSADGFYIAAATNNASGAQSCTWTGDEGGLTERYDTTNSFGFSHSGATAAGTAAATNDNTITATFAISGNMRVIAASWR